jgi:hypothetical protein
MISKRIVFWVSLLGTLFFSFVALLEFGNHCDFYNLCEKNYGIISFFGLNMLLFPVILFFSILTYFMRNEVFLAWLKFAAVYVPLFILTTYSFMMHGPNGGGWAISGGLFLALILFSLLFLFFLISLILIIAKYISLRHKQAQISPQNFPQNQK